MPKYAASYIDWFDHELTTVIVEADCFHNAVLQHPKVASIVKDQPETKDDILKLNPENVKQMFFDMDSMVEAIRID